MSENNILGIQDGFPVETPQPGYAPQQSNPKLGDYKFSNDEMQVLKECNQESFFQRSLPLGTIMGFGTYVATQKGFVRPNPRFGAYPKVTLAIILGYFIGKLSYQEKCAEKLMALPGSYIGQLLREKKEGRQSTGFNRSSPQPPTMFGAGPNDIYSDAGPGSSLDLDTDRPLFNEDSYRSDSPPPEARRLDEAAGGIGKPGLSYDELRRKNRGEFAESRQDPYRVEPNLAPYKPVAPPSQPPPAPSNAKRNKYGDIVD